MSERHEGIVGVVGARDDGCEVVCTLPEASLGERSEWVAREIVPRVIAHARVADGFRLEFAPDPQVRRKLEQWAELERGCCQEARFVVDEPTGVLRLTVHGIDPAGSALARLLDEGETPARPLARIAAAGGVGAVGAFLLLCVLPTAVIAVAGATVAGPLARLESPPMLAAATLLIGAGFWGWRRRARARAGRDCGC